MEMKKSGKEPISRLKKRSNNLIFHPSLKIFDLNLKIIVKRKKEFKILNNLYFNKAYNYDEVPNNRFDVDAKKILRFSRLFYDNKLEDAFKVKKLRRKISRQTCSNPMKMKPYLEYTDKLVDQIFSRQLM